MWYNLVKNNSYTIANAHCAHWTSERDTTLNRSSEFSSEIQPTWAAHVHIFAFPLPNIYLCVSVCVDVFIHSFGRTICFNYLITFHQTGRLSCWLQKIFSPFSSMWCAAVCCCSLFISTVTNVDNHKTEHFVSRLVKYTAWTQNNKAKKDSESSQQPIWLCMCVCVLVLLNEGWKFSPRKNQLTGYAFVCVKLKSFNFLIFVPLTVYGCCCLLMLHSPK